MLYAGIGYFTLNITAMKKIYILMIAFAISFISCSDEQQEEQVTPTSPKTYTVSLGLKGEILDVIQTPLTRSGENNDLYGIQVYLKTNIAEYYTPYAYGLFDDINNLFITLFEGYDYKFECTMIVNGKNILSTSSPNWYSAPFELNTYAENGSYHIPLKNELTFNSKVYIDYISSGYTHLGWKYSHPNTDRYYGAILDFQPVENSTINIEMKRTVFGVKFIANGLTEGKLKIVMNGAPELYINSTDAKHEIEDIFTFYNVGNAFNEENYSEGINTSIYWEKADGTKVPIAVNYTLTFTRKMMHTVRINLAGTETRGGTPISITLEDGVLGTGKDYTIGQTQN